MISAIIVAAGKGTRMGADTDKLFLEVCGRPVLAHTWQRFDQSLYIDEIVVVCRAGMETAMQELAAQFAFRKPFRCLAGGQERQDSVWNGLAAIHPAAEIAAIHDGARPCVSDALIAATIEAARRTGAAVAAQPVTDTIKESEDGKMIRGNVNRARLWAVQTPQTFRVPVIRRALAAVRERGISITDETTACEFIGQAVELVPGAEPNPKVTVPADLDLIAALLGKNLPVTS